MDEREILRIAAHHDIDEYLTEALTLEFVRDVLKAARRTTPDRDAIIEECAKVCDEYAADQWSLYKGRAPYTGSEPGRADPDVQGRSDGADVCAARIRELKTTQTAASSSEATDTERLNWLAWIGIAIRN
ncbi:TPA: hypothetical protein ACXND4_000160 [Burkholderia multivorans]